MISQKMYNKLSCLGFEIYMICIMTSSTQIAGAVPTTQTWELSSRGTRIIS